MIHFIIYQFLLIHKGTAIMKFKSTLVLSVMTAIPVSLIDVLYDWIDNNIAYIGFVLFAIFIDYLLGTFVHAFIKRDFSMKKNIIGIFLKLSLVFTVGILFEGFQFIYPEDNFITKYLSLITRLMVFLYPAGSAFMNCAVVTNGKFPPIGWMKKLSKFNQNLDINQFKNEENENQYGQDYYDEQDK